MEKSKKLFEAQLRMYATLYFIIGLIETELRKRIMIALSSLAAEKGYREWLDVVPKSFGNLRSVRVAYRNNQYSWDGVEEFLTFSFWRHLFDGSNYTLLCIPELYTVFPGLENPKSWKSFAQVGNHMARANRIRNMVAHYSFREVTDFQRDKEILIWIKQQQQLVFLHNMLH